MKSCSMPPVTKEAQIKTTMRHHFSHPLKRLLLKKKKKCWPRTLVEKLELLCMGGRNVKWYFCCGKQPGGSSKIKSRVAICSSNSILGVHPKEVKAWTCTGLCTLVFRAALFIVARSKKQPKGPLIDVG